MAWHFHLRLQCALHLYTGPDICLWYETGRKLRHKRGKTRACALLSNLLWKRCGRDSYIRTNMGRVVSGKSASFHFISPQVFGGSVVVDLN